MSGTLLETCTQTAKSARPGTVTHVTQFPLLVAGRAFIGFAGSKRPFSVHESDRACEGAATLPGRPFTDGIAAVADIVVLTLIAFQSKGAAPMLWRLSEHFTRSTNLPRPHGRIRRRVPSSRGWKIVACSRGFPQSPKFRSPVSPGTKRFGITAGPDGNLWFTDATADAIGEINPTTHAISSFPFPQPVPIPYGITAGPDGNIWFTEYGVAQQHRDDQSRPPTPSREFTLPTRKLGPDGDHDGPRRQPLVHRARRRTRSG